MFRNFFKLNIYTIVSRLLLSVILLPIHEVSHGYAAYKLGDPTAKNQGRLSLNPLKHLNPMGTISLVLFGIGWAEPVPVNPRNFKNYKRDTAIVAFAGPLSNFLLGGIFIFLSFLLMVVFGVTQNSIVVNILSTLGLSSIYLGVFNMLPIPPLDGSKVVGAFLPDRVYNKFIELGSRIRTILIMLVWVGVLIFRFLLWQEKSPRFLFGLPS